MPRTYTAAKRRNALALLDRGLSAEEVARLKRVHPATVRRWAEDRGADSRAMVVDVVASKARTIWRPTISVKPVSRRTWGGASVKVIMPWLHEAAECQLQNQLRADPQVQDAISAARRRLEQLGAPKHVPPRDLARWPDFGAYSRILAEVQEAVIAAMERHGWRVVRE